MLAFVIVVAWVYTCCICFVVDLRVASVVVLVIRYCLLGVVCWVFGFGCFDLNCCVAVVCLCAGLFVFCLALVDCGLLGSWCICCFAAVRFWI